MFPDLTKKKSNLVNNVFWASGHMVGANLFLFLTNLLVIRLFSPESHGQVVLLISLTSLLMVLSGLGVAKVAIRNIAQVRSRHDQQAGDLVILYVWLNIVTAIAMGIIVWLSSSVIQVWLPLIDQTGLTVVALWIAMSGLSQAMMFVVRGFEQARWGMLVGIIPELWRLAWTAVCGILGYDLKVLYWGWTLGFALTLFIDWWVLRRFLGEALTSIRLNWGILRTGFRRLYHSLPYFVSTLGLIGLVYVLQILTGLWHGGAAVSQVQVALSLALIPRMIGMSISIALFPRAAYLFALGESAEGKLDRLLRHTMSFTALIGALALIFYAVTGKWLLGFLYGPEYESAYLALIVFAVAIAIEASASQLEQVLTATGKVRLVVIAEVIKFVILVGGAWYWVRLMGPDGAAWLAFSAIVVYALVLGVASPNSFRWMLLARIGAILCLGTGIIISAVYGLAWPLVIVIGAVLCVATGLFRIAEIRFWWDQTRQALAAGKSK